jgi:hypothetical protein
VNEYGSKRRASFTEESAQEGGRRRDRPHRGGDHDLVGLCEPGARHLYSAGGGHRRRRVRSMREPGPMWGRLWVRSHGQRMLLLPPGHLVCRCDSVQVQPALPGRLEVRCSHVLRADRDLRAGVRRRCSRERRSAVDSGLSRRTRWTLGEGLRQEALSRRVLRLQVDDDVGDRYRKPLARRVHHSSLQPVGPALRVCGDDHLVGTERP